MGHQAGWGLPISPCPNRPPCHEALEQAHGRLPQRTPGASVTLRLRHPGAAPMRSVMVNGKRWTRFDPKREIIRLPFVKGETEVVAKY